MGYEPTIRAGYPLTKRFEAIIRRLRGAEDEYPVAKTRVLEYAFDLLEREDDDTLRRLCARRDAVVNGSSGVSKRPGVYAAISASGATGTTYREVGRVAVCSATKTREHVDALVAEGKVRREKEPKGVRVRLYAVGNAGSAGSAGNADGPCDGAGSFSTVTANLAVVPDAYDFVTWHDPYMDEVDVILHNKTVEVEEQEKQLSSLRHDWDKRSLTDRIDPPEFDAYVAYARSRDGILK